jgi:uncharacterized protein (TIGR02444 family)
MDRSTASYSLTTEQLWQFSVKYYDVKGVKEACLSLQNQFKGNVNTLLLLTYLDQHQLSVNSDELEKLINVTERTDTLITDYRTLRKSLKEHIPDALYRNSLKFELKLEQRQQADLVNIFNTLTPFKSQQNNLVSTYCHRLKASHLLASFIELPQ